ncbi:hypothetical protein MY1884_004372 [Beauveria asiatica]
MDNDNEDDKNQPLRELSLTHGSSIISQLVDIGNYEDPCNGRYRVEGWEDNRLTTSPVRDCVLDRILNYMRHVKIHFLWIDAHCICQDTCSVALCTIHGHCTQKRNALQAMDLVYQLSKHPVALLARPLLMASELKLLARILSGQLVDGNTTFQLSRATTLHEGREALWLLCEITRDVWWGRAWTFQENYRGGQQMRLLIRHHQSLEQKKNKEIFDKIQGELCVRSVIFCTEATRLCLALRSTTDLPPDDICRINAIIIANIKARRLSKP